MWVGVSLFLSLAGATAIVHPAGPKDTAALRRLNFSVIRVCYAERFRINIVRQMSFRSLPVLALAIAKLAARKLPAIPRFLPVL